MTHSAAIQDGFYATVGQQHPAVYRCERGTMYYASGGSYHGSLYCELRAATDWEIARWKQRKSKTTKGMHQRLRAEELAPLAI